MFLKVVSKIASINDMTKDFSKILKTLPENRISPEERRKFLRVFEEMLMRELS